MPVSRWKPQQSRAARLARTSESMTPGTLQGRVGRAKAATVPTTQRNMAPVVRNAVFSWASTPDANVESPAYVVKGDGYISSLTLTGTGTFKAVVSINGHSKTGVTLSSGTYKVKDDLDIDVDVFDRITATLTSVSGTDVSLTVEIVEN